MKGTQVWTTAVALGDVPSPEIVCTPLLPPDASDHNKKLRINVLFTDLEATEVALRCAVELASDLEAVTQLIVPHFVPYALPLEKPAVPIEFTCKKLRILAASAGADPYIHIYLCRNVIDVLLKVLPGGSFVVLGAKCGWLSGRRADKIARRLRQNGCNVIFVRYEHSKQLHENRRVP
jgi:hypothetical protein